MLGIAQLGPTEIEAGLGLRQLGLDVGVLDAGDHLPRPHPVPLDDAQVNQPPGALRRHGGLALGHDVAAGDEHGPGARRREGGPGEPHRQCGGEHAGRAEQDRPQEDGNGGGEADGQPAPMAQGGGRRRRFGLPVDPQRGQVRLLGVHGPES